MSRVNESILDMYEISNKGTKRIDFQVDKIAKEHLAIGTKKGEFAENQCKAAGIENPTMHDKGQHTLLHLSLIHI